MADTRPDFSVPGEPPEAGSDASPRARAGQDAFAAFGMATPEDREHLRLIVEMADLYVWQLDIPSQTVAASANAETVLGFRCPTGVEELRACIHPDDREAVEARFRRLYAGARSYEAEYRFVGPAGQVVWVHSRGHRIGDDAAPRIAGVTQNITGRKLRELNAAFLIDLTDAIGAGHDIAPLVDLAIARLGEYLGAGQVRWIPADGPPRAWPHQGGPDEDAPQTGGASIVVAAGAATLAVSRVSDLPWHPEQIDVIRQTAARLAAAIERASAGAALDASQAEIERQQRLLDTTLASVGDFIFVWDLTRRFVYANRRLEALWGLAPGTYKGRTMRDLGYAPELAALLERQIDEAVATRASVAGEVPYTNPAGAAGYYEYIFTPIIGADGAVELVAGVARDTTERRRAEAERARLAAIVEQSRDAVVGIDLAGVVADWNPAAERLCGYLEAEMAGQPVTRLVPEESRETFDADLARLRRGEIVAPFETRWVCADGSMVDVEAQASAIRDVTGRIVGVGIIARDASTRKRLERAQTDFLAMVSHDLRSPVTVFSGRAQLMQRRQRYDPDGIAVILEQGRRIDRLVADLQELVHLEAGGLELRRMPLDLRDVVAAAADRASMRGTHILRVEAPEAPVTGRWDSDRLAQVLDNLLGNALKYAPAGTAIEITVERIAATGMARVGVRDHGAGIPRATLTQLFDRFYRADRDRTAPGLGLGLYIARMLVEAHGGRIWATSTRGEGSTFRFTLPLGDT